VYVCVREKERERGMEKRRESTCAMISSRIAIASTSADAQARFAAWSYVR
jgi:hypothetical protein